MCAIEILIVSYRNKKVLQNEIGIDRISENQNDELLLSRFVLHNSEDNRAIFCCRLIKKKISHQANFLFLNILIFMSIFEC